MSDLHFNLLLVAAEPTGIDVSLTNVDNVY